MVLELIFLVAAAATQQTQKDRCAPNEIDKSVQRTNSGMACVNRNGHCVSVTIDGRPTVPLTDEKVAARVHAIKHGQESEDRSCAQGSMTPGHHAPRSAGVRLKGRLESTI